MRIAFVIGAVLAAAVVGCGSDVQTPGSAAGAGGAATGASTGTYASTADGVPCDETCCDGPSCCGACDSAAVSTGSGSTGICGGKAGVPCAVDEYCDYESNHCGNFDETGVCRPRPMGCPENYSPTCACDGVVYGNACEAAAAGVDVRDDGGCPAQEGMFGCGSGFCDAASSYCRRDTSDTGGPDGYQCVALPASCGSPPDCACLAGEPCAEFLCEETADGGLRVTCPGG